MGKTSIPGFSFLRNGITRSSTGRTLFPINDIEIVASLVVHTLQASIGSKNVQPVRIKHVDLMGEGFQRGKTACIPRHIKGGANALRLVENDLRRRQF